MNIIKILLKLVGKDTFIIDQDVGTYYLLSLCWKYGWMIVRGWKHSFGYPHIAKNVFIGRRVKLIEKKSIVIGSKSKIHDGVKIDALSKQGVLIGEKCVIGRDTCIETTGSLAYVGKGVKIGDRTSFGSDCFFGAAGGITVGNDVIGGQYIRFHSENHNYEDVLELIKNQGVTHQGIVIGNNCWIGSGVVFLDGAEIGDGCVVAANAVVTKKFPSNVVIGGVPAKIIKYRG